MASLAGAGGDEGSSSSDVAGEEAGEDEDGVVVGEGDELFGGEAFGAFGDEDGDGDDLGDADGASLAMATPTMATKRRVRTNT